MSTEHLPVGEPASEGSAGVLPERRDYTGAYVTLAPVEPDRDVRELYEISHGSAEREALWTYMGYGPFQGADAMAEWLRGNASSEDSLFLTVHQKDPGRRVGMVSFLNIVAPMRRLEVGHIWYGREVRRTNVNTECIYLMLRETFDRLRYRRAEWKCDALNARSRAAAVRLGFRFEGVFSQHMVVKGRNRDTAWYAMMDDEWPDVRQNMEAWLYGPGKGEPSLSELNARHD